MDFFQQDTETLSPLPLHFGMHTAKILVEHGIGERYKSLKKYFKAQFHVTWHRENMRRDFECNGIHN